MKLRDIKHGLNKADTQQQLCSNVFKKSHVGFCASLVHMDGLHTMFVSHSDPPINLLQMIEF